MNKRLAQHNGKLALMRIDWRAYFYKFIEAHGDPVKYGEHFLLFPDGWLYSIHHYQGPEIEPKPRKVRQLQCIHWDTVWVHVGNELRLLQAQLRELEALENSKSLPIQQRVSYYNNGDGKASTTSEDLDLTGLKAQIDDLQERFDESVRMKHKCQPRGKS